jgi:hypothetical protein
MSRSSGPKRVGGSGFDVADASCVSSCISLTSRWSKDYSPTFAAASPRIPRLCSHIFFSMDFLKCERNRPMMVGK